MKECCRDPGRLRKSRILCVEPVLHSIWCATARLLIFGQYCGKRKGEIRLGSFQIQGIYPPLRTAIRMEALKALRYAANQGDIGRRLRAQGDGVPENDYREAYKILRKNRP